MFDGVGAPGALRAPVQFHHICDARDAQRLAAERHAGDGANAAAHLRREGVHPFMGDVALGSGDIVGPDLLDMDQCALPWAEQEVL